MILLLLAIFAALSGVGVAEALLPRLARMLRTLAAAICAGGLVLSIIDLLLVLPTAGLHVPFGPPGVGISFSLDGLSAFFLLPVFIAGAAGLFVARDEAIPVAPLIPIFIAAMGFTVLAADGFSLFVGFEAMSVASWLLVLSGRAKAGRIYMAMALIGALALLAAMAVGFGMGGDFNAWRTHSSSDLRAAVFLALLLIGAGSQAGLAHPAAPAPVAAMMSGAMTKVALYVILRLAFDLAGPSPPLWWGVPLLILGASGALLGAARANFEGDFKSVLAADSIAHGGVIAVALGVALTARAAHLPLLASLALGAGLLHVLGHAIAKTLMFLIAGAVERATETQRLDRLGGLIMFMPITAFCAMAGAASLAALPPLVGFASIWMLFQGLITAPHLGSFLLQMLMPLVALLLAGSCALALSAMLRLVGIGFLGRPRAVRTAGAQETRLPVSLLLVACAAALFLFGLLPGLALRLAAPALQMLTGADFSGRSGIFGVAAQPGGAFYGALPVAAMLIAITIVVWFALRRHPALSRGARAWDCGNPAPPPFLPFGDTTAQYSPASLSEPLGRSLGRALFGWRMTTQALEPGDPAPAHFEVSWHDPLLRFLHAPILRARDFLADHAELIQRLTIRRTLAMMVGALVILLLLVALLEQS